ncbi:hypothetical protein [Mycobacterium sp. 29Ha]|uniref:hypothetical protein n=1 Tax=Mycobacterium sp. 29Ha TaxID=2939268 RepID=UPI00293936C4|nr:hypothetical protein [Mycobacterium sp. 29Ha]MDV3135327.1 hypothetical protein [Mycobacterium sp. 29Ha]
MDVLDEETVKLTAGHQILGWWTYILDTSDDDNYPFVSYGEILLLDNGRIFSRGPSVKWGAAEAFWPDCRTVSEVEARAQRVGSNYELTRIDWRDTGASQ